MDFWIEGADNLRLPESMPLALPSKATMPTTEGTEENASPVFADCTISGDRGMLVLQVADADRSRFRHGMESAT